MSKLLLVPYCQYNGEWTLPPDILKFSWQKLVQEETAKVVFYDGKVKTEEEFITMCQLPDVHTHFLFREDNGDVAGIGWLNNFAGNSAHCHWVCFKCIWGRTSDRAIRQTLKYWFSFALDEKPLFDTILGIYPEDNEGIDIFAKRNGFTVIGKIPNLLHNYWEDRKVGAVFSYIERRQIWDS
jgi:hypothetical protein